MSRSLRAGAEWLHTPTEEDAIRRLRSAPFIGIGLTLALGLSAWALTPEAPTTDDFGAADVASFGEATGFAISGAETGEDGTVSLHGFAAPGSLVHVGEFITVATDLGTWTLTIESEGSTITVVVEGPDGRRETKTIELGDFLAPEEEDDVAGDEPPVQISIVQTRATSDSERPSALFEGTAPPGTGILGKSDYGIEDLRVGMDGTFVLEIGFTNAPAGTPFPITVFIGDDYEFHGEFLWTFEADEEPKEEPTEEPKEEPKATGISIDQYTGSSDSPEPWEKFSGTAPAGTKIAISSAYGSSNGYAGSSGEFSVKVWFGGLETTTTFPITVWVGDRKFTFSYTWYAPTWKATANQKWGECDAAEPYDVFWGTAAPGTKVKIQSEYGSAELSVGDKGQWEKKVFFPNAPRGQEFPVTVWVGDTKFQFSFEALEIDHDTWASQKWDVVDGETAWNKYFGHGTPGATVRITSEYGSKELTIGESGEWLKEVAFDPPANTWFHVTVKVGDGYTQTFEMKWHHEEPIDVEFTAHQHVGESHSLWELFWGTADPGTKVKAESEYGSGYAYANESGEYEFDLVFDGVAPNTTFTISVTNQGETKTFSFTYLGPEGGGEES